MKPKAKMTLTYIKDMGPVDYQPANRTGHVLGSGRGKISGIISGDVEWTISEVVGNTCETSIYGSIITETSDTVHFETKGFGTRLSPDDNPDLWHMPAVLILKTSAESLLRLNDRIFFLKGSFDMGKGTHRYDLLNTE